MSEISKLKQRLGNINKNVTEYRMTVNEAKNLVKEFEVLQDSISEMKKVVDQLSLELKNRPEVEYESIRILDGGRF